MARYFKYFCRVCHKDTLQKVDETDPAKTPIPYCCKSLRNSAYKGMVDLGSQELCDDEGCPQHGTTHVCLDKKEEPNG